MDTKLIDEKTISYQPFLMHDFWHVIGGMSFGGDEQPSSFVKLVWDRNLDIVYLDMAWKRSETSARVAWITNKQWLENLPTAWPAEGLQPTTNSRDETVPKVQLYYEEGFNMLRRHATSEDGDAEVKATITKIYELMLQEKFKVACQLFEVFDEIKQYDESRIVKEMGPILAATCYAFMMMKSSAIRLCDRFPDPRASLSKEGKKGRKMGKLSDKGY